MSRLAKKSIILPDAVTAKEEEGQVSIKGPKGELKVPVLPFLEVKIDDNLLSIKNINETKQGRANAGTMWSLCRNAVIGVTAGFSKTLVIEGVGYRANLEGKTLVLSLGYVQPVRVEVPAEIFAAVEKNLIRITGIDKNLVGQVAAEIRKLKKPEPYKGKGIRYQNEVVRRKAGKKAVTGAAAG